MVTQEIGEHMLDARVLRNEPVQARSSVRLSGLMDAAAAIVDEIGYERLTTAMVAERAGSSIGTVYRYFPDRITLLQALAARNLDRVLTRIGTEIVDAKHTDWAAALGAAFEILVEAFRSEPGFRGLRVGDVLDLRPAAHDHTFNSIVSNRMLDGIISRFGVEDSPELRLRFESVMAVSDALATRAFARDPQGDEAFLSAGRDAVYLMLSPLLGEVTAHH